MKGVRKQFSKALHDGHDEKARNQAKAFWTKRGYLVKDNPNTKGVDLFLCNPDTEEIMAYLEVEVKNNWNSKAFQYDTLQIPERKARYFVEYGDKIIYMVFSKDLTQAFIADSLSFKNAKLKEVPNKFVSKGEYFYQVPVKDCDLVSMEEA